MRKYGITHKNVFSNLNACFIHKLKLKYSLRFFYLNIFRSLMELQKDLQSTKRKITYVNDNNIFL